MQYTMENALVSVTINHHGAELSSFILKSDGTEYIWQGNPQVWGRHAPILFPIVGRLKDNRYRIGEQEYFLTQHGFARDFPFEPIIAKADHCTFRLTDNPTTLEKYPYPFQLDVNYHLIDTTLEIQYKVQNTGKDVMYFSIGGHPGFNCPLLPEMETMKDYYLEFNEVENVHRLCIRDGLIAKESVPFLQNESWFSLSPSLFKEDAVVLHNLASTKIKLASQTSGKYVTMDFSGFPYLGIWSKADGAPFVCLEPWFGLADSVDADHNFAAKRGIQTLEPQDVFSCTYSITIG